MFPWNQIYLLFCICTFDLHLIFLIFILTQNFISKKYVNSYIFHLFASKVNDGLLYNCMCIINDYTEYRKDVLTHLTRSLVTVGIYDAFVLLSISWCILENGRMFLQKTKCQTGVERFNFFPSRKQICSFVFLGNSLPVQLYQVVL